MMCEGEKKDMSLRCRTKYQRGLLLVEAMIAIALIGVILASAIYLNRSAEDQSKGRNTADTLSTFQQLASQYYLANRDVFDTAMRGNASSAATYCLINVPAPGSAGSGTTAANSTKRTCAFDTTHLRGQYQWPSDLDVNADYGNGRYVAIVRQIMQTDGVTETGATEMLIVLAPLSSGNVLTTGTVSFTGDIKRKSEELTTAMNTIGGAAGYIPPGTDFGPCQYNTTTKQVCGNGWTVTLSDFIN
jgi:type II secretory pathway pseudopilin PulG